MIFFLYFFKKWFLFSFYSSWESRACTLAVNTVTHPLWNTLFPSTQKLTFKILWVFIFSSFFYKNPVILFCHHHHDEHDHWSAMIMMMIMINLYHKHDQWSLIMMIMTNIQHKESGLHIAAGTDSLGLSSFSVKQELNKNEVRHHNYHHTHHHYHHHHHHHDLVSRTRRLHPTWRKKIKKIYVLFWKIVSKITFQPNVFEKILWSKNLELGGK